MFLCIATASALVLAPVAKPVYRSIEYFDAQRQVTERVLDRSICSDIERIHPVDQSAWDSLQDEEKARREALTKKRRERNVEAVERHCRHSIRVGLKNVKECDLN